MDKSNFWKSIKSRFIRNNQSLHKDGEEEVCEDGPTATTAAPLSLKPAHCGNQYSCKYQNSKSPDEWKHLNVPPPQSPDLIRAVGAFMVILVIVYIFSYYFLKIKVASSFVFSLIVAFILLNILFFPHRINTFSEFNSGLAIYILIQTFTPLVIYIYAIWTALHSKRCSKNWI